VSSPLFVVVSGLPASGKSTLGRTLANELALPMIDKDDLLEAAFVGEQVTTPEDRSRLSRAADDRFIVKAEAGEGAVLCSHWRWPGSDEASGTPSDWLTSGSTPVIEVHCRCPPELAAHRFLERRRHPAHFDRRFTKAQLVAAFTDQDASGPLGVGPLITVDTAGDVEVDSVVREIRDLTEPRVRLATPSEGAELAKLRQASHREHRERVDIASADAPSFRSDFCAWWEQRQGSHVAVVAEVAGRLVGEGFLALVSRPPEPGNVERWHGDVQSMYVLPGYRGIGIGSRILERLVCEAADRGCVRVTVHSGRRALTLYRRAGFEPFERLLLRDVADPLI
jgi:GNAT superfamily N-acetyltransferase